MRLLLLTLSSDAALPVAVLAESASAVVAWDARAGTLQLVINCCGALLPPKLTTELLVLLTQRTS